jgi:hypothetical protein
MKLGEMGFANQFSNFASARCSYRESGHSRLADFFLIG